MIVPNRIVPSFESLPPEANQVATQAYASMDEWIDRKVDAVRQSMQTQLDSAVAVVNDEVAKLQQSIADNRASIDKVATSLVELAKDLDSGDGQTINDALAATQKSIESVKGELARYEQSWKTVGAAAVDKITTAVKAIIG